MSWPSPLYVLTKDEQIITITGAKYRATVLESDIGMGIPYQDDPVAVLGVQASGTSDTLFTAPQSGINLYGGSQQALDDAGTLSSTPADYASDKITHTLRQKTMDKSKYVWYDSPPLVRSVTTTTGSITVTMGSTVGLIVGMEVSGTGIPSGSTIVSIDANGTDFVISQPCTASATVTGSFTGNVVGDCWVVDYVNASATLPAYMS